ncbi:unnamed protein product [Caretta caretta]
MTSKIQLLDQDVIAIFKQHDQRNLVRQMIESELSVTDFLKKLTIKDFFYTGGNSWNLLLAETINCCWMVGLKESFGHPLLEESEESRSQSDEEFDFEGFTEEEVGRTDMEWMQELCQQLSGLELTVLPLNIESWIRGDDEAEEF